MITDSYGDMVSEMGLRSALGGGSSNDYSEELERLLRERARERGLSERERELSLLRSGSAPPIVGASDPAYGSYYYQHQNVNLNPPSPMLSKEEWRQLQVPGGSGSRCGSAIGDRRKIGGGGGGGESVFSVQPDWVGSKDERKMQAKEWSGDGLIGLPGIGLGGSQQKRVVDIFQEKSISGAPLSRNTTPDPQAVRSPSPHIPSLSDTRVSSIDRRNANAPNLYNTVSADMAESADLVASLSGLSLSMDESKYPTPLMQDEVDVHHNNLFHMQRNKNHIKQNLYSNSGGNSPPQYLNTASPTSSLSNYGLGGYPASPLLFGNQMVGNINNIPPLVDNVTGNGSGINARALGGGLMLDSNLSALAELENIAIHGNQSLNIDPSYLQYLRSNGYSAAALNDLIMNREYLASSQAEFLALQKAYFEALLQKSQHDLAFGKSNTMRNGFHGNSAFGRGFPYPVNPMGPTSFPSSRIMGFPSSLRNIAGNFTGQWPAENGCNLDEGFAASLLDEFKGNKTRCFELAEIAGHVVEFSADQYGSRFIQQKLETASTQEKNMVFHEIMPQALSLMTDVFGNYVIQKFFEHGSAPQIRQLAEHLIGHVLTLSLQMYGCRVIQKAIEVIELDQQTQMVAELDGHVMRCVRDQNGNHVIQKCIECVPEAAIQFIISTFYDQVVTLSTHPYGCRVVQRVLEHCHSPKTQSVVMTEILNSVCVLAQDQYGNYVIQHVLEHGKPHERSSIISQLTGKIVEMSQQKFASNVIEKCLSFGTPEERQTLVHEMLGSTDENEPLQVMMKDQFANYVVQKVLETCDDQQLELLLNRIKVHLNALKKYTYGKHIVARVEKLVAAGERRISTLASYSTA